MAEEPDGKDDRSGHRVEPQLYRRGGVWWIRYRYQGKPYRDSSGSTKKTDVKQFLDGRHGRRFGPARRAERRADDLRVSASRPTSPRREVRAANGAINRELTPLKRMFRLGQRAKLLVQVPEIRFLEERNACRGLFDPDRFRAVLGQLPEHLRPIVEVAFIMGWRVRSEAITRE